MTIRVRLTLWYTAILFLILVVFGVLVYLGLTRSLMVATDDHLQREAAQIIGELRFEPAEDEDDEDHDDDGAEPEESEHSAGEDEWVRQIRGVRIELDYIPEEGVLWRLLDSEGVPVLDPGFFNGAQLPAQAAGTFFSYVTLADETPVRLYTAPFTIEERGAGIVQVGESYADIQTVQRQLLFLLLVSVPFVLLVASGGGWFLAASALSPIDRITRAAEQISAKELHQRLNLDLPNDEVGRLAATFDNMLHRLDDAFERQRRFIADASHEIRTPLTILQGDVEVALNRPRTAKEYRETLEMVNQTTHRLSVLVEELLLLARADNNQIPLDLEPFDLADLLARELDHLAPRARARQIELALDTPGSLPMTGDPNKLARLFINLIDNAIKYSDEGDRICVSARQSAADEIEVRVSDTGPGIPPDHLVHLFDRFYRVDEARARDRAETNGRGGVGLGLSIAQWLAQLHNGRIEVDSEVGSGTTFIVTLKSHPENSSLTLPL